MSAAADNKHGAACCGTCHWWDRSMSGGFWQFYDGTKEQRGDACRRPQWSYPPLRPAMPHMEILTMENFYCSAWVSKGGQR